MASTVRNVVVMYSRDGCCLCDDALAALRALEAELALDITVIDIAGNPELESRYGPSIPVVFVNDRLALKGRIDPEKLRRRLKGGGILARLSERLGLSGHRAS